MSQTSARTLRAQLFRLLGDETRIRIIESLFSGPVNVSQIASSLNSEQSLISHHLQELRKRNLVVAVRSGKEVYYDLSKAIRGSGERKELEFACCSIKFPSRKR